MWDNSMYNDQNQPNQQAAPYGQGAMPPYTPPQSIDTSTGSPAPLSPPPVDPMTFAQNVTNGGSVSSSVQSASQEPSIDLQTLKARAISALTPIVGNLDQSAEEKFHTTMMLLQATDDQTLLKTAMDAAQAIQDDKKRAQALLDVLNEVNYFMQMSAKNNTAPVNQ